MVGCMQWRFYSRLGAIAAPNTCLAITFLGFILGAAGLFSKDKSKATAIVGLILGLVGACMFFAFLSAIGNA